LKSIAGILDFEEGEITFVVIRSNAIQWPSKSGWIHTRQSRRLRIVDRDPYLNFVGDVFQVPLEKRRALIEEFAKMFEIEGVLANPMSSYSLGMKQKLS
jgi:ABC-2 type transport system ATP-binding protein